MPKHASSTTVLVIVGLLQNAPIALPELIVAIWMLSVLDERAGPIQTRLLAHGAVLEGLVEEALSLRSLEKTATPLAPLRGA